MRLGTGRSAKTTIEVCTSLDVGYSFGDIDEMQQTKKRQSIEGTVKESCVRLTPLVTSEGTGLWVLEGCNNCKGGEWDIIL